MKTIVAFSYFRVYNISIDKKYTRKSAKYEEVF